MDINTSLIIIQSVATLIAFISATILYLTIKNNHTLNKINLFNELVKQERELRIKLSEYREEIHRRIDNGKDSDD